VKRKEEVVRRGEEWRGEQRREAYLALRVFDAHSDVGSTTF